MNNYHERKRISKNKKVKIIQRVEQYNINKTACAVIDITECQRRDKNQQRVRHCPRKKMNRRKEKRCREISIGYTHDTVLKPVSKPVLDKSSEKKLLRNRSKNEVCKNVFCRYPADASPGEKNPEQMPEKPCGTKKTQHSDILFISFVHDKFCIVL